ncbi:hypothetical protein TNCV_809511 [Trichonephila clavipes]|uniref:Uncharacterized protein n=1 Tax=Trichonephila clavipes TaxID=2585209 RepID=A0A8X6SBT1_TRICX|nr:hypothetical protein TNCV_809511 [Trichonephila clavipes]
MIRKKEVMVSELKTLPPCSRLDCQDHKIPSTSVDEEITSQAMIRKRRLCKPNKKKLSKKRKNKAKESTEEFILPKKTARPISPTPTQDLIETNNHFSDLEQDVEHPLPTEKLVITEVVTPKKTLPHLIMLKIKDNFREQITCISKKFPSKPDGSCTPIGPPLLKSRPLLQTQVSNTTIIRVPDRGLKAAGAA